MSIHQKSHPALRATGRIVAFAVAVIIVLAFAASPGEKLLAALLHANPEPGSPNQITASFIALRWVDVALIVCVMAAAAFHERVGMAQAYGLESRGGIPRRILLGTASGIAAVTLVCGALLALRVMHIGNSLLSLGPGLKSGLAWGAAFLAVAAMEELLFRGYPLFTLSPVIGFWPASLLLSLLFMLAHVHNAGETTAGLTAVLLFGLLFCVMIRRTGSLWLGIGLHAGWDWAQSFLFGVADSGTIARGRLVEATFDGPGWLTGGTAGPEGSVITLALLVVAIVVVASGKHQTLGAIPTTT